MPFNSTALTLNANLIGANGMESALLVANKGYYVFIIGSSNKSKPVAGLLSALQFGARVPAGYDIVKRIGYIFTDGSANIVKFYQSGCGTERTYFIDVLSPFLLAGSATTMTAVALNSSGPVIPQNSYGGLVYLDVAYTPSVSTHIVEFLPADSSATSGIVRFGTGVAALQFGQVCVPFRLIGGTPQIKYKVGAGDLVTLSVAGFTDSLAA